MLFNAIKKLITAGRTDGLRDRVDVLYAAGSLTTAQYNEIVELLG